MRRHYTLQLLALSSTTKNIHAFTLPHRRRHPNINCRLKASLSDQLSSLSYDNEFIGKLSQAAEKGLREAPSTSVHAEVKSSVVDNLPSLPQFALPTIALPEVALPIVSAAEAIETVTSVVQIYETLVDDKLSAYLGETWTTIKVQLAPVFNELIHPNLPPSVTLLIASYVTYSLFSALLSIGQEPPPSSPYPMNRYDPISARRYFDQRVVQVARRAIEVTFFSTTFLSALLGDFLTGKLEANSEKRAEELSVLLTKLGPSFIKIGQSLSIRTDLLSPAYVRGLKSLQDQVPPFNNEEARSIIENELGSSLGELFVNFPKEPVAAASLGQVYKATIRDAEGGTRDVAVKVQRPNIMNQVALDMHLIREVAPVIKRTFNLNTDFVGVVDTWGSGFIDELDYIEEALNAKSFTESIKQTPLSGVVSSPLVVDELTTRKVLTTEWVVGERLDKSEKGDVAILCSIAMNSYLTMMLETGLLHCDPHPGNLLRTTDGKLCILDWGMVTRLDSDLQLTLIEHMAHLTSADYEEVPKDLLLLGFIPEDKADLIRDSGVVETLAEIYGAWTAGGGAAAVNVNKVIADLQDLTAEKGNLFQIPSFSVLEGIGLSNDANYSIINECLPYVSKRLLTDQSERTGGALSTFIFGPSKTDEDRIIDYDRVEQLVTGFGSYTTSTSGELLGQNSTRAEQIENVATQLLDLLATEEESPLQSIFIEQVAKIITASTRTAWSNIRENSGSLPSGRSVLGFLLDPLGIFRTSPVIRASDLDERTVETTRNLIQLLTTTAASSSSSFDVSTLSNAEIVEITSIVVAKLWERRSGVAKTSNRLATELLRLTADRLDKGEREILVVPSPVNEAEDISEIKESQPSRKNSSERLASARQILATIE